MNDVLHEVVDEVLRNRDLSYQFDEQAAIFHLHLTGERGFYHTLVVIRDDEVRTVCVAPLRTPEGCRKEIAEAIARINMKLRLGRFLLDFADGELCYDTVLPCGESRPEESVVAGVIGLPSQMMDEHISIFLSIIYANTTAEEACAVLKPC